MGIVNKIKLGAKNATSKIGEEADLIGIKGKMNSEKKKLDDLYREMGEYYFKNREEWKKAQKEEMAKYCERVEESLKVIADYESQVQDTKDKAHSDRETNRKNLQ